MGDVVSGQPMAVAGKAFLKPVGPGTGSEESLPRISPSSTGSGGCAAGKREEKQKMLAGTLRGELCRCRA